MKKPSGPAFALGLLKINQLEHLLDSFVKSKRLGKGSNSLTVVVCSVNSSSLNHDEEAFGPSFCFEEADSRCGHLSNGWFSLFISHVIPHHVRVGEDAHHLVGF